MNRMLTFLLAGAMQSRATPQFFDNLLRWREQFEDVLQDPSGNGESFYTNVGSETLGGAHGDALYPVGSASERYIVSYLEGASGGMLVYEKRSGNHAVVVWHVPFVPAKKKRPVTGTVRKYLQREGFVLSPKAHLSRAIRRQLDRTGSFAAYSYHHMMGGFAYVVGPKGDCTVVRKSNKRFSITAEEIALLKRRAATKTK